MNESPFEKIKKYFEETPIAKFDTLFIESSVEEIFCNKEYDWFLCRNVSFYQYIHVSGIELNDIGDDCINVVIYCEDTAECDHWTISESYPLKWFTDENEMKAAIKEYEEEKERKREVDKEKRHNEYMKLKNEFEREK